MKPKNNTRQLKLFSFINKVVSRKFYYSVIVRTCFQKDNYDSLIHFFILCSYSDLYIYNLTVLSLLLLLVVIGFSIFYLYYKNSQSNSKEKTLTKQSQEQKASTDAKESQELEESKKRLVAQIVGEFIDIIDENTQKKILYARITSLRDPRPQPAREIVPCELCDQLRGRRVSIGDFVWLEFDAKKPSYYYIVYIVSTVDYGF